MRKRDERDGEEQRDAYLPWCPALMGPCAGVDVTCL